MTDAAILNGRQPNEVQRATSTALDLVLAELGITFDRWVVLNAVAAESLPAEVGMLVPALSAALDELMAELSAGMCSGSQSSPLQPRPMCSPADSNPERCGDFSARDITGTLSAVPLTNGFNHVATLTTDMDLTVRFYEEAFDAVVTFEVPKRDDHPWMKILDLGGSAALNVFEVPADEIIGERRRQGGRGAIDHYALAVDSYATLELAKERLVAAGAQEVGDIQRLGDEWSLFFRDPDGMELEVCCPADAAT